MRDDAGIEVVLLNNVDSGAWCNFEVRLEGSRET